MIYLSGVSNERVIAAAERNPERLGLMATPSNGHVAKVERFRWWAADNACFTEGNKFNLAAFLSWLERHASHRERCLFATAPDVVGDAQATLARSTPALGPIRERGFRAAFVAQDGLDPRDVPWDAIDCLFVGGTNRYKFSTAAAAAVSEAKRRGKWVHNGRVNSHRRLEASAMIGCDSADGTRIRYHPDIHLRDVERWLKRLEEQPPLRHTWGSE